VSLAFFDRIAVGYSLVLTSTRTHEIRAGLGMSF
jgi:hypothetical protein